MKKFLVLCITLVIVSLGITKVEAKTLFYVIPKGTMVLAFIGNPHSSILKPVRLVSYQDQVVLLFHRKSGRGIWAFYLRGFLHDDPVKGRMEITKQGYFVLSRRKVRRR